MVFWPRPARVTEMDSVKDSLLIALGLIAVALMACLGGYGLEAAGECLRNKATDINSNELSVFFAHHSLGYRIAVTIPWALALYGALYLFSLLFRKIDMPFLEAVAVVVGVVAAALYPPSFLRGLCLG